MRQCYRNVSIFNATMIFLLPMCRALGAFVLSFPHHAPRILPIRAFTVSSNALSKPLPPRPILHDADIIENFLKGSGPGGQKINKTSSAVQLKHIPTGIVVKYQDTRSRTVNRKMARKILQERIEEMELGEEARTKVRQREKGKRKRSGEKKRRRKYRKLAEGEKGEVLEDGVEVDGVIEIEGRDEDVRDGKVEDEVSIQTARRRERG